MEGIVEWPSMCNGLAGGFMPRRSQLIITFADNPGENLKPESTNFLMNAVHVWGPQTGPVFSAAKRFHPQWVELERFLFLGPHSGLVFGPSFWSWASLGTGSIMSEKVPHV